MSDGSEVRPGTVANMQAVRKMQDRMKQTSAVVMNYDVIAAMYGIDLERTGGDTTTLQNGGAPDTKEPEPPF